MRKEMRIESPLIICFEHDGKTITHIHPGKFTHEHYGMLIADIVRHISRAFKVGEDEVWEWVDEERHHPTTDVQEVKVQ
jgi:hypothetical protein